MPLSGVQIPLPAPALSETPPPISNAEPALQGVELASFTPLLSLPALKAAAEAYALEDYAACAAQVDAYVQRTTLDALDEPRWQLLLGSLREKARDLAGASRAYERALQGAWPLVDYAALGLGRCALELGHLERAQRELERVPESSAAFPAARGLRAEAACRAGATRACLSLARAFVAEPRKTGGWAVTGFRIAEMLVNQLTQPPSDPANVESQLEALAFLRSLANGAPNSADRFGASKLEQQLLGALPESVRAERQRLSPAEQLERAEAMENAERHADADALVEALITELKAASFGPVGCQARLLQGRALAKLKQRQQAVDRLSQVAMHCKGDDVRAWALYLAGKSAFQDARYPESERLLDQLERELPRHRLADDARLYRAQAQREMGVEARFSELLDSMPADYPEGDMTLDGVFLLALRQLEKGNWVGATSVLERAVQLAGPLATQRGEGAGRERYFAARAMIETGEIERGLAGYEAIIGQLPLSYYMLHAYSRLSERDAARGQRALEEALTRAGSAPFRIEHRPEFDQPAFLRALELLRQSEVDSARRELERSGVLGANASPGVLWGVASLYARAGSARHSHAVVRWQLREWAERWPAGPWRQAWELAFPRPHVDVVTLEAKRQGIEPELVYAIMREESAFDADAVSPANAYGLMQIISPTAQRYGKEAGLPYDREALTTPRVSIAIGSLVLSSYRGRFPQDPLLAIPGYNAGPGRPKRWARDWPSVDFDVWVELIPYRETRLYTKRVLASRAAYAYLYYQTPDSDPLRLPRRLSASASN